MLNSWLSLQIWTTDEAYMMQVKPSQIDTDKEQYQEQAAPGSGLLRWWTICPDWCFLRQPVRWQPRMTLRLCP